MNVACPSCGNESPVGRVICSHCGGKLHTVPVQKKGASRVASGVAKGLGKLIKGLIRLTITVALLGLIGLVFWPVEPQGTVGSPADAERVQAAMKFMSGKKDTPRPTPVTLSELEINSYLLKQVENTTTTGGGVQLEGLRIDLHRENLLFHAGLALGPAKISWELTLEPKATTGEQPAFPFEIVKARLGHFPMLGGLKQFAGRKVSGLFSAFDKEQEVLESLKQVKLSEDAIQIVR